MIDATSIRSEPSSVSARPRVKREWSLWPKSAAIHAIRASFKRIICDDISELARSQHENGYGRVIEDRPGATAKNFFSQRTCTIAPHDEKIGTASLGCRRK